MNFGAGLLLICALCAIIGIYRGVMNWRREKGFVRPILAPAPIARRSVPSRVVWLNAAEFLRLIKSEPDTVVFHLTNGTEPGSNVRIVSGELIVTLQQFKDTLPWIPLGSRLVLYRPGGIDAAIARRLIAIAGGRELRLVAENLPVAVEDPVVAGGAACN